MCLKTKNSDNYDEKYMKTKFNSDVELPLNKIIELHSMMIVVRAVFHENDKNNPPVYLAMQLILIKKVHRKSAIFVTVGIF